MRAALGWCALLALAGCNEIPFYCSTDQQCVRQGQAGWCEKDHRCSFEDTGGCSSGRRYAPFGTGESCVPAAPACSVAGLAAGSNFTCAWSNAGHVACWGENGNGQVGDGTIVSRPAPVKLMLSNVVEVAAGQIHACARHDDGAVSCWGDNSAQQLGIMDGTTGNKTSPVKLRALDQVAGLTAGGRHTCARRNDHSLWCWGRNTNGQLGDGTMLNHDAPTVVPSLASGVEEVSAGDTHTCARTSAGAVSCWGAIRNGAVAPSLQPGQALPGPITGLPPATRIASGDTHTCALAGGGVYCWGLNDVGQVGDRALGRSLGPTLVPNLAQVGDLSTGGSHSCAVLADGSARCWGGGAFGQLGGAAVDSGTFAVASPGAPWKQVVAGLRHTCALSTAGEVYCWGRDGEGQLGDGAALQVTAPQAAVVGARDLTAIAAGGEHTCALTTTGAVLCWGRGDFGQLATADPTGSSSPVPVTLPGPAAQVVSGSEFACARLADGAVVCWGRGNRGQIGDGFTADRRKATAVGLPDKAVHVAAGAEHACAALASGAVYCWGDAGGGRLGNGVMASAPQGKPIAVPMVGDAVAVGAGNSHGCALGRNKQVICWGMSNYGQAAVAPGPAAVPPTPVAGLSDVAALAVGGDHACAVTTAGVLWCWGRGDSGQLGFGGTTTQGQGLSQPLAIQNFGPVAAASAAAGHSCAVVGGAGYCWGSNRFGQLGLGTTMNSPKPAAVIKLPGAVAIDGGDRHSCAVLTDGTAVCWGSNQYGQLGNGAPLEHPQPTRVALECP
jgi:alpha-tubulin suppressor-like RCC1 family protein